MPSYTSRTGTRLTDFTRHARLASEWLWNLPDEGMAMEQAFLAFLATVRTAPCELR